VRFFFCVALFVTTFLRADSPPPPKSKKLVSDRLALAAFQIALDNAGFSPGIIDGHSGSKTSQAVKLAEEAGVIIEPPTEPWQLWEVPSGFQTNLTLVPTSWRVKASMPALNHETPLEKIAERFHLSQDFLQLLNSKISDWNQVEGISLKVPILSPAKLPKADYLSVSLGSKVIIAFDADNHPLASFPCSIAAKKEKRPVGSLQVVALAKNPDYLFDPIVFPEVPEAATMKSKLMIPPGPNNPVGEMWIGLNLKGYGIHGTPFPEDIGKTESHGCFRLTNWDAKRLGTMLRIGTPIHITE
jgi:lipoprotein-anchoring transpeptidase ErfK/SrfK